MCYKEGKKNNRLIFFFTKYRKWHRNVCLYHELSTLPLAPLGPCGPCAPGRPRAPAAPGFPPVPLAPVKY